MAEPKMVMNYNDYMTSKRLAAGRIYMFGPIGHGCATHLMADIFEARRLGADKLVVFLNSPGGDVSEALAVHDVIQAAGDVEVVAYGMSASAACMVVLQGAAKRSTFANTRFMLHELSRWVSEGPEKASETADTARELKLLMTHMLGVLAARTGKSVQEIQKFIGRKNRWLTAEEARAWGLVDNVVSSL